MATGMGWDGGADPWERCHHPTPCQHLQPRLCQGQVCHQLLCPLLIYSKAAWWEEPKTKCIQVMVGNLSTSGALLLSAPALNLLPLWGCLLFLSACSSLIPQDFYSDSPGGFEINLDHRKLKTPQAKLFTVPSEALAIAVATEWDSQKDTIKFYTMHLVSTAGWSAETSKCRVWRQQIFLLLMSRKLGLPLGCLEGICVTRGTWEGAGECYWE